MNRSRKTNAPSSPPDAGRGDYIVMNGKRLELEQHPTDFSVLVPAEHLARAIEAPKTALYEAIKGKVKSEAPVQPLSAGIARMQAKDAKSRDELMDEVRRENVAHHIYRVAGTGEEIAIDNRIFLTLRNEDPELLEQIIEDFHLVPEGRMADAYILRVTEATGQNPLKTANAIAEREGVVSCTPQVLVPLQSFQTPLFDSHRLFRHQWYLSSDLVSSPDLDPTAGINAPEAWQVTAGSPDIVIAVIDDGFDLNHPAFRNKRIHPARRDFAVLPQDSDPSSEQADFHGTCVASIATGSFDGDGMIGVAPGCTFLPIRIGFGPLAAQVDILEVFRYVSRFADVVNCSFGTPPRSFDVFTPQFRNALTQLTRTGGRRGKGLIIVFAAGNDDAPTLLPAARNTNGVKYVDLNVGRVREIPAGSDVFSGYPLTRGVIVVGAMSSLKRKTGYSNWGPHLTVTAPSNNMHYITRFIRPGSPDEAIRALFVANYRGLGQVAAVNRSGKGRPFEPLRDNADTPDFNESLYTMTFGGTSGAAPVVTGVVALMLSVNPHLTASQVRQILMSTADRGLDTDLDLATDPNVQGVNGSFTGNSSLFFGAGKVNALRAVERARALLGPSISLQPVVTVNTNFAPVRAEQRCQNCSQARSEREGNVTVEILPNAETEPTLIDMSPEQCIAWRLGEFHQRVRRAVADWAGVAAQNVLPDTQLGQLRPWNLGSQGNLVQSVNVHEVFAPPFPNTRMLPLSQLLSPATTVAQWEKVVWQRQFPVTPCLPFTD
jgi:subtilisin family serine protease